MCRWNSVQPKGLRTAGFVVTLPTDCAPESPQLHLATGGSSGPGEGRLGAVWITTFVDRDMRVGRGRDGEAFLFRRKEPR